MTNNEFKILKVFKEKKSVQLDGLISELKKHGIYESEIMDFIREFNKRGAIRNSLRHKRFATNLGADITDSWYYLTLYGNRIYWINKFNRGHWFLKPVIIGVSISVTAAILIGILHWGLHIPLPIHRP